MRAIGAREVLAILGILLIAAGLALVSIPAALVTTGAILLLLAIGPLIWATRKEPD